MHHTKDCIYGRRVLGKITKFDFGLILSYASWHRVLCIQQNCHSSYQIFRKDCGKRLDWTISQKYALYSISYTFFISDAQWQKNWMMEEVRHSCLVLVPTLKENWHVIAALNFVHDVQPVWWKILWKIKRIWESKKDFSCCPSYSNGFWGYQGLEQSPVCVFGYA